MHHRCAFGSALFSVDIGMEIRSTPVLNLSGLYGAKY